MPVELLTVDQGESKGTISALIVDGVVVCWTLELPWNDNKANISCVPAGEYPLVLEYSPKFGRDLYELKGVPGRSEIKIHIANWQYQIQGCIVPGTEPMMDNGKYYVKSSTPMFDKFMKAMGGRMKDTIIISNRPEL